MVWWSKTPLGLAFVRDVISRNPGRITVLLLILFAVQLRRTDACNRAAKALVGEHGSQHIARSRSCDGCRAVRHLRRHRRVLLRLLAAERRPLFELLRSIDPLLILTRAHDVGHGIFEMLRRKIRTAAAAAPHRLLS